MSRFPKSETIFLSFLVIFNLVLRIVRLDKPPVPYLNEKYFILPAVRDILKGLGDTQPITPPSPLGKLLFAFSIKMFGDNPLGWRILSVIFATISVIITYFLAKEITDNKTVAKIAAILLTFEFAFFVHSRSADPEALVITFVLLSLLFAWKIISNYQLRWTIASGLSLGLAIAIKPQAFLIIIAVILAILILLGTQFRKRIYLSFLILFISGCIYLVIYLPVFQKGGIMGFVTLHQAILQYHTQYWPQNYYQVMSQSEYGPRLPQFNKYLRQPITWLQNPKIVYFEQNTQDKKQVVLFTFHPAIFFPTTAIFLLALLLQFRKKDRKIIFLLLVASSAYFPYLLSSLYKPLTYPPYYFLSSLPPLIILLSFFLCWLWHKAKMLLVIYLIIVVVLFIIYYPLLTAIPIDYQYFQSISSLK